VRWLGIPYARAARFAAPVSVPFDAARSYETFGPAAPQPLDSPLGSIVPGMDVATYDEDACLTLNVWAPDDAAGLPVLVWFHGGSFVIGATSQPVYDGALLASEQRVVVVTVNYRLGALGFLDARPLGGVANCGVRDAICALEWVRDNITSFGGDPTRVVAFGESAGGGLLLHALASPLSAGLVAGAIVQSGATFATLNEEDAGFVRDALAMEADGADLTTLSIDALLKTQSDAMAHTLLTHIGMMPFHPMIDGEVVLARPADAFAAGAASDVALLVGTTDNEMRLFADGTAIPADRLVRRVARYLAIDEGEAAEVIARYDGPDTAAVWCSIFSDNEMVQPARAVFDAHAAHGPTYAYLFTWEGPKVGACHGIDIPFPFGNFGDGWAEFVGADDDTHALSRLMRDAWAAFAREQNPGWDAYPATMILGRKPHVEPSHPLFGRLAAL
jgi:para-nitrobenzyl esterase